MLILIILLGSSIKHEANAVSNGKMEQVFAWKQIGYDFDGVKYTRDSNYEKKTHAINYDEDLEDKDKFFIQYNNIPIGFEVYEDIVFVTVPRRRHGIPSTLNYVSRKASSPLLKPYPDTRPGDLVSVYRPRVDSCNRLWMVDTGLLEVPDARRQVQPPSIVIYDLKTKKRLLKYELKPNNLLSNRTSGGLTSITVDVSPSSCEDAYAYINDLATETMIVFSLKDKDSWSIEHGSFKHDEDSLNFTVAGNIIPWKDGLFSIAISDADRHGRKKVYYHPLVSTQEFYVYAADLKNKIVMDRTFMAEGTRGPNTQSGSHAYHSGTRTLIYANIAQDAILCWNIDLPLTPEHIAIIAQDHEKLVYIAGYHGYIRPQNHIYLAFSPQACPCSCSSNIQCWKSNLEANSKNLKIVGDDVWVLVNQIPRFVFSVLDPKEDNFYIHKGSIPEMIKGTPCDQRRKKWHR